MDLNLAFEDEDLDVSRNRTDKNDVKLPYHVKLCTPEWFRTSEAEDERLRADPEHRHQVLKFKADLLYHKKKFSEAAMEYEAVLDVLPENNTTVWQDTTESLCRCYLNCGRTEESLQLARDLVSKFSTEDEARQRQSLILLSSVCEKAERWAECVEALEKYCCLQPFFAQAWAKLGDAFINSESSCDDSMLEIKHSERNFNFVRALTCYVRGRFLCETSLGTSSQLTKERDKQFVAEMTEKIDHIPLSNDEKTFASRFIPKDSEHMQPDDLIKTDHCDVGLSSSEIFFKKFCSWSEAYQSGS